MAILDITEQKRLEAAARYQADIANAAGDAILATDTDFKINFWNRSAQKLYGWRPEDVAGKTPAEMLHIEYLSGTDREEARRQLFQAGYWEGIVSVIRKDGSKISVVACTTILRDSKGNMMGTVGSHHEITELKRVEQALEDFAF